MKMIHIKYSTCDHSGNLPECEARDIDVLDNLLTIKPAKNKKFSLKHARHDGGLQQSYHPVAEQGI